MFVEGVTYSFIQLAADLKNVTDEQNNPLIMIVYYIHCFQLIFNVDIST
jgi:hypothetical protein